MYAVRSSLYLSSISACLVNVSQEIFKEIRVTLYILYPSFFCQQ